MFRILYTSLASKAMSSDDLRNLLASARLQNEKVLVTGMLVYNAGEFLQVLEGDPASVITTFDRIATDPRHQKESISTLQRGIYGQGLFRTWSMGFKSIDGVTPFSVNTRIKLRNLDALSALDLLVECARAQNL